MSPTLSNRHKALLSVSLAVLLLIPSTLAVHNEQTLVTGHTTFANLSDYDTCMASVAGIVRSQVMWFNDMVLAERYAGKGTYIYITENGAEDPRYNQHDQLYSEGVTYTFTDPNGIPWTVREAFWTDRTFNAGADVEEVRTSAGKTAGGAVTEGEVAWDGFSVNYQVLGNRTYVWIVELAAVPIYDMFAGQDPENAHTYYNFVSLVDTCKMRDNRTQPPVEGDPDHYNVTHDTPEELNAQHGHKNGETPHSHEAKMADIWVGKETTIVPIVGAGTTDGARWESDWASGEAEDTTTQGQNIANGDEPPPSPPTPPSESP